MQKQRDCKDTKIKANNVKVTVGPVTTTVTGKAQSLISQKHSSGKYGQGLSSHFKLMCV